MRKKCLFNALQTIRFWPGMCSSFSFCSFFLFIPECFHFLYFFFFFIFGGKRRGGVKITGCDGRKFRLLCLNCHLMRMQSGTLTKKGKKWHDSRRECDLFEPHGELNLTDVGGVRVWRRPIRRPPATELSPKLSLSNDDLRYSRHLPPDLRQPYRYPHSHAHISRRSQWSVFGVNRCSTSHF